VVDAEDRRLGEDGVEHAVELLRRREVAAEGLLDDDPGVLGATRRPEVLDDDREQARRDRQVVRRFRGTGGLQLLGERREGLALGVVAVDVVQ
jgi:hypothetical protein